jgi:A/G-specific adenine glycosylase
MAASRRQAFQAALLGWYREAARPLRLRSTRDPWAILVAEVMAQQTQIARVDEAWASFLARFSTPSALAEASPGEALRAWSGLGYNRRAINLQRAARLIVSCHGGQVPDSVAALEALPGIGPYTARAVAALAFGRPVAAVDTNVRRVVIRVLGHQLPTGELQAAADALVAHDDVASWTHATMELGATVCLARRPLCEACPVRHLCSSAGRVDAVDGAGRATVPRAGDRPQRPPPQVPFEATTRWLRGRIVARLRDADGGEWTRLPETLGSHGPDRIASAVAALHRDGLLELHADGSVRLPSVTP